MCLRWMLVLSLLLAASAASAAEGVYQIGPACVADGCFDGDSPGWPVEIMHPGSYRLTGNLDLSDHPSPATATGIDVSTGGGAVLLDLNGFSVIGPITCTGEPVTSCSVAPGAGYGIRSGSRMTVRNGTVRGFSYGVNCSGACTYENLLALHNSGAGLATSNSASLVRNSIAQYNGDYGIFAQGRIENNVAEHNMGVGLYMNPRSIGQGNVVRGNGGNGMRCFTCLMVDNLVIGNGGFGVLFGTASSWHGNVVYDNAGGETSGSALSLGPNRCGSTTCP